MVCEAVEIKKGPVPPSSFLPNPKIEADLLLPWEETGLGFKSKTLEEVKEACFEFWTKYGFYWMPSILKRVLHSPKSGVSTYIFKVFFLPTGTFSLQGTAGEIDTALSHLPIKFKANPQLTLCLSEDLKESLGYFLSSLNSNFQSNDEIWTFGNLISSLFKLRIEHPQAKTISSFCKDFLRIPPPLHYFFGFINRYISNLVDWGSKGYFAQIVGKILAPSAPLSKKNFNNTDELLKDSAKLVSAFLEDYVRNMKGWEWKRIKGNFVFTHFLIWASKLSRSSIIFSSFPYKTEFIRVLKSLPGVRLIKSRGEEKFVFEDVVLEDPEAPAIKSPSTFLDNYTDCEEMYKEAIQARNKKEDLLKAKSLSETRKNFEEDIQPSLNDKKEIYKKPKTPLKEVSVSEDQSDLKVLATLELKPPTPVASSEKSTGDFEEEVSDKDSKEEIQPPLSSKKETPKKSSGPVISAGDFFRRDKFEKEKAQTKEYRLKKKEMFSRFKTPPKVFNAKKAGEELESYFRKENLN